MQNLNQFIMLRPYNKQGASIAVIASKTIEMQYGLSTRNTAMSMKNRIISLLVLVFATATTALPALAQDKDLKTDAPDRYTVQRGDTLWGIAGRYLERPWNWPQLWNMNRTQVRNPHRIYPGDVLVLDRRSGQLRVETVTLSPRVRDEDISKAVPTISPSAIAPFLSRPMIINENEFDNAPRIMATEESRSMVGTGNVIYVKGLNKAQGETWQLFRRGDKLIDPEAGGLLGYLAVYLGEARVLQFGEVSKLEIIKSTQEILTGDALVPISKEPPIFAYAPRAPGSKVQGRVMGLNDNLFETGSLSIISLSKGAKDGLEVGHVLALVRNPGSSRYSLRTSPMLGRTGPAGSDARRPYYEEQLDVRNSPVISQQRLSDLTDADVAKIPNDRYGLVMVFRTFDRASFALVMQANRPVAIDDVVTTP